MKKRCLSTPICVYIWLLAITVCMLFIGVNKCSALAKNVGYSLLASFVATIIIDIGNTKARLDAESQQHEALTEGLRYAIIDLKESVAVQYESSFGNAKGDIKIQDCIYKLLTLENKNTKGINVCNEEFFYIGENIARPINRIKTTCEILEKTIYYNTNISILSKEERKKIHTIGNAARVIDGSFKAGKYRNGMNIIIKKLLPAIYEYDIAFKEEFEKNFSISEL